MKHLERKTPFEVSGSIRVPGDKSISHRALMLSALAHGRSRVRGLLVGDDVQSTARVLRSCGCDIPELSDDIVITGVGAGGMRSPDDSLYCGNSGTTARLLMGVVAGSDGITAQFDGDSSLRSRPMNRIADPLARVGAHIRYDSGKDGRLPLTVSGTKLNEIEYTSPHASAQIKSALLLGGFCSRVAVTVYEPHKSRDHTERMLAARGVAIEVLPNGVRLQSNQQLEACDTVVPGDPSSAAFFAALAALADRGEIRLENVCLNETRVGFFEVLARMGASVATESVTISGGEPVGTLIVSPAILRGVTVADKEVPRCIDELPLVACLAARADNGSETVIRGAAELRVKESDRITAVVNNLRSIGVEASELPDGLVVRGSNSPLRGFVTTFGDHRLAMAFGVLAACPENDIVIDDKECASVSYPSFWSDLNSVIASSSSQTQTQTQTQTQKSFADVSIKGGRVKHMVIAIDGPAASGKSSTAQWVAKRLAVRHVDSGALYRAITWLALEHAGEAANWSADEVSKLFGLVAWRYSSNSVLPDVTGVSSDEALRSARVTQQVSRIAAMPEVRAWVNEKVREASLNSDVVVDGRDIGTAVFPDAFLKVFLIADPWERARRRLVQRLGRRPTDSEIASETEELVARDARDATQSAPSRDAITIDTTTLTQEEQVDRIVALARAIQDRLQGSLEA